MFPDSSLPWFVGHADLDTNRVSGKTYKSVLSLSILQGFVANLIKLPIKHNPYVGGRGDWCSIHCLAAYIGQKGMSQTYVLHNLEIIIMNGQWTADDN